MRWCVNIPRDKNGERHLSRGMCKKLPKVDADESAGSVVCADDIGVLIHGSRDFWQLTLRLGCVRTAGVQKRNSIQKSSPVMMHNVQVNYSNGLWVAHLINMSETNLLLYYTLYTNRPLEWLRALCVQMHGVFFGSRILRLEFCP